MRFERFRKRLIATIDIEIVIVIKIEIVADFEC